MLKKLQQKLLGYTRVSSKRSMLFYAAMLFNFAALAHYIFMNMDFIMEFHTMVAVIGMVIGVLMMLLFDMNSIVSALFLVIVAMAPRFFFSFIMGYFQTGTTHYIMYVACSLVFLVMEFFGLVLTCDIYDSSEKTK